jgi:hypothetical protein
MKSKESKYAADTLLYNFFFELGLSMKIVNQLEQSQGVAQSMNTALHKSQGAQFSMLLSLLTTPLYASDIQGIDSNAQVDMLRQNLEADTKSRKTAMVVNRAFNHSMVSGYGGYFSFLRALSDVFPHIQQVTGVRTAEAAQLYRVVETPELGEQLARQINLAA